MTPIFAILLAIGSSISTSLLLISLRTQRRRTKMEKLLCSFNEAVAAFNLCIAKGERLGNRMLGFDAVSNKVLFLEASGHKQDGYLIDLNDIQSCRIKNEYGNLNIGLKGGDSAEAYVNTIALQLDYINGAKPALLPFYDRATDGAFEMRARAELAKQWQAVLSARLPHKREKIEPRNRSVKRTYVAKIEEAASFRRVPENTIVLSHPASLCN